MMTSTLIRPIFLSFKNKLLSKNKEKPSIFNQEFLILVSSSFVMLITYKATQALFEEITSNTTFANILPPKITSLCFLLLFLLLIFSNGIAALSYLFNAKDLEMMLTLPLNKREFFTARLFNIMLNSCWMLLLFTIPIFFGFASVYELSVDFIVICLFVTFLLLAITSSIACIAVTLLVNICPAYRIKEILAVLSVFFAVSLLIIGQKTTEVEFASQLSSKPKVARKDHLKSAAIFLSSLDDPNPKWFPSKWAAESINSYTNDKSKLLPEIAKLLAATALTYLIALLLFSKLHKRGWNFSLQTKSPHKKYNSNLTRKITSILIPFNQPLRALVAKEMRSFLRDTTQSLQLFVLLFLTCVYIYNFRALRNFSGFSPDVIVWWKCALSIANVTLGACVVAAIATRFVYPSVSLEGKSYYLIRLTPLSIHRYLKNKFILWLIPILFLSSLLLLSGSFAIQSSFETILATLFASICISIGICGIGIGIGSVYSKFDWESPTQISASFGSLVYMFLSLTTVGISTIPCIMIFTLTNVPSIKDSLPQSQYFALLGSSTLVLLLINYSAARWALKAGAEKLRELER